MKTKLLKIVRKRFNIIYYNKITDPTSSLYSAYNNKEVWIFNDNNIWSNSFDSYEMAYKYLCYVIKLKYYKTKKKDRISMETKVWYK